MLKRTPLYAAHQQAGGKLVDFAGWEMPLHYGSQVQEHHAVRQDAGMFDVSHMAVLDISGQDAQRFLRYVLANDVARLTTPGKALYTCMLNPHGGVIDDLLAYFFTPTQYRLIVNAGTQHTDLAWLMQHQGAFDVVIQPRPELAIIAVQGPQARAKAATALSTAQAQLVSTLKPFHSGMVDDCFIARTGYTGEDGLEIVVPATQVVALWQALLAAEIKPCGLGARDTLRLEAGLNLYGHDMDEDTTPLESNLTWTVAWEPTDRDFIGRPALTVQRQHGATRQLVGLVLTERGVLRDGQVVVLEDGQQGVITSGSFSPSLQRAIALARIPAGNYLQCQVNIRDKPVPARIVAPVFVRNGKSQIVE